MEESFPAPDTFSEREVISFYAKCGIKYRHISDIMAKYHNINLSANAICKRLKRYGFHLRRGLPALSGNELYVIVKKKLDTLPRTVGYRQLTEILKREGHNVRRDQVMYTMRDADPVGVQARRRRQLIRRTYVAKGPNQTWHIDGYDKLKPYGFPIHGCIDGYSRKIMWLEVGPSNNDPKQTAYHYMQCVNEMKGCPLKVQGDRGTENTVIGALQCLFTGNTPGFVGDTAFQHIPSKLNQRIEAWWSFLRKRCTQWWMEFFTDLFSSGTFNSTDPMALKILQFTFMPVIQRNLNSVVHEWNNQHIRHSRLAACPNGIPNVLHSVPESHGGTDHLHEVNDEYIQFGFTQTQAPSLTGERDFDQFAVNTSMRLGLETPSTWQEALQQFYTLYYYRV